MSVMSPFPCHLSLHLAGLKQAQLPASALYDKEQQHGRLYSSTGRLYSGQVQ